MVVPPFQRLHNAPWASMQPSGAGYSGWRAAAAASSSSSSAKQRRGLPARCGLGAGRSSCSMCGCSGVWSAGGAGAGLEQRRCLVLDAGAAAAAAVGASAAAPATAARGSVVDGCGALRSPVGGPGRGGRGAAPRLDTPGAGLFLLPARATICACGCGVASPLSL
jgi:hypothetical protein